MPESKTVYEIHPAIGIARLGNSEEGYFFGPEPAIDEAVYKSGKAMPTIARTPPPATFRDSRGKLLRQAVRFRVFKVDVDDQGNVSKAEVGSDNKIEWSVHLANRKAVAIRFADRNKPAQERRNKQAPLQELIIDGGLQVISADEPSRGQVIQGTFRTETNIVLGKAWVAKNRLHVLGGHGNSRSIPRTDLDDTEDGFADSDNWYDDTSDGPVYAKVRVDDEWIDAVPAWVIVAPFDFAPEIENYISLHDVAHQAAIDGGMLAPPKTTSFVDDVLPLLERVRRYRWVNGPTLRAETQDRHARWSTPERIAMLANPLNQEGRKPRKQLFAHLAAPEGVEPPPRSARQVLMPRLFNSEPDESGNRADAVLPLMHFQYQHMKNWADDKFETAAAAKLEFPCDALDRISLEACVGGAFYPGIEVPRIVLNRHIYSMPYRLKAKKNGDPASPDPVPAAHTDANFAGLVPGQVTEGLCVPWQSDFSYCQQERENAWWPSIRPDHVFQEGKPQVRADSHSEWTVRWDDNVDGPEEMVGKWHRLGVVRRVEAVPDPSVPVEELELRGYEIEIGTDGMKRYYCFRETERRLADSADRTAHFPKHGT
jgi:hypothetical protein